MNLKIPYKSFSILFLGALTGTALASDFPAGSCQPSNSMSVLVAGKDVFSFVPKGGSLQVPLQNDIVLVRVEPDGIPLKTIQTDNVVNSCASNSRTGQTVCTSTEKDVYVFSGPILTSKLNSSGSGKSVFSGAVCTNCGVTMDAVHDRALIGLSLGLVSGYQYVDLGPRAWLEEAFPSQAPSYPGGEISKGILIDPIRNWILSANESGNYEIIKLANQKDDKKDNKKDNERKDKDRKSAKGNNRKDDADDDDNDDDKGDRSWRKDKDRKSAKHNNRKDDADDDDNDDDEGDRSREGFFENTVSQSISFGSAGEDCSTGIALATVEPFSEPRFDIYIADLTQAVFTPGSPGTWRAPYRFKVLSELDTPPSDIAVAQGTHIGIVARMSSNSITAIKLPAVSGSGIPDIKDWVTCTIPAITGNAPHTVNAYQSPNTGHAISLIRDFFAKTLTVVDLTKMLELPRVGNRCEMGLLPPNVMSTISLP